MSGFTAVIKRHRTDIIIITLILAAALVIYLFSLKTNEGVTAEVLQNGKLVYSIELDKVTDSQAVSLEGGIEIHIGTDGIGFLASDCPDKICVGCGILNRAGQTAVCVPNKTVIRLKSTARSAPDIISY